MRLDHHQLRHRRYRHRRRHHHLHPLHHCLILIYVVSKFRLLESIGDGLRPGKRVEGEGENRGKKRVRG